MTNFTTRMMIAATTIMVAAGVASAQSLKAEIPFSFRAGNKMMAAGSYQITKLQSGAPLFRFANANSGYRIILLPRAASDAEKTWENVGKPVLRFECGGTTCALAGLWTGLGNPQYDFSRPKLGMEGPVSVATIALRPDRAD